MIGCLHVYILVHPSSCLVARLWFRFLCPTLQSLPCEPCAASAEPGSRRTAAWAEPGSSGCPGNQITRTCICRAWPMEIQATKRALSTKSESKTEARKKNLPCNAWNPHRRPPQSACMACRLVPLGRTLTWHSHHWWEWHHHVLTSAFIYAKGTCFVP